MKQQRIRDGELYANIRAGDATAVNALIENWYGMVVRRVETFARSRGGVPPEVFDDLVGDALLAVVEAINGMREPHDEIVSLRSYLNKIISRSLLNSAACHSAAKSPTIAPPPGTVRKRLYRQKKRKSIDCKAATECIDPPTADRCVACNQATLDFYPVDPVTNTRVARGVICASCHADLLRRHTRENASTYVEPDLTRLTQADGKRMSDLRDAIDSCCETDLERDYVRVQSEAYPEHLADKQVGEALGASDTTVWRARQAIERRYQELQLAQGA